MLEIDLRVPISLHTLSTGQAMEAGSGNYCHGVLIRCSFTC